MNATEFGKIMQNNGHYAIQGHSRSLVLVWIPLARTALCIASNVDNADAL